MPTYLHVLTVHVLSESTTIPRVLASTVTSDGADVVAVEGHGDPVVLTAEEADTLTQKEST